MFNPGKLYVVATPIGNLGDMPQRAIDTLKAVDFIATEDTRVSGVLLARFDIRKPCVSYHKFNESGRAEGIVARVLEGQSCAVISDAGTPGISDPGAVLVEMAAAAGIEIIGIPGPSAVTLALSVCGFKSVSSAFYGFLPKARGARQALLTAYGDSPELAVFFESPNRIARTVGLINDIDSGASLVLCNDLTKKYELVYRGTPEEVLAALGANPSAGKGGYTVVIRKGRVTHAEETAADISSQTSSPISTEAMLIDLCVKECFTLKDAINRLYDISGGKLTKKEIYAASLCLKKLFEK